MSQIGTPDGMPQIGNQMELPILAPRLGASVLLPGGVPQIDFKMGHPRMAPGWGSQIGKQMGSQEWCSDGLPQIVSQMERPRDGCKISSQKRRPDWYLRKGAPDCIDCLTDSVPQISSQMRYPRLASRWGTLDWPQDWHPRWDAPDWHQNGAAHIGSKMGRLRLAPRWGIPDWLPDGGPRLICR